jgi:hypothetical protein
MLIESKESNKKLILGVVLISLVTIFSSVLAANLTLTDRGTTQSAQGITLTTTCDDGITFSPNSRFAPAPLASASPTPSPVQTPSNYDSYDYRLNTFTFSGIDLIEPGLDFQTDASGNTYSADASNHAGRYLDSAGEWKKSCLGKWFVIHAYPNSNFNSYALTSTDSDLILGTSCQTSCTSIPNSLINFGYAFKVSKSGSSYAVSIATQNLGNYDVNDLDVSVISDLTESSIAIVGFGFKYRTIPAEAVKTVTIESMDELPSDFVINGCNLCS